MRKRVWELIDESMQPVAGSKRYDESRRVDEGTEAIVGGTNQSERVVASRIGVNHDTLHRWLTDKQSPMKGMLASTACFLRRVGDLLSGLLLGWSVAVNTGSLLIGFAALCASLAVE
jgi:hypothetical protein